jgi:hypothetical protein
MPAAVGYHAWLQTCPEQVWCDGVRAHVVFSLTTPQEVSCGTKTALRAADGRHRCSKHSRETPSGTPNWYCNMQGLEIRGTCSCLARVMCPALTCATSLLPSSSTDSSTAGSTPSAGAVSTISLQQAILHRN